MNPEARSTSKPISMAQIKIWTERQMKIRAKKLFLIWNILRLKKENT